MWEGVMREVVHCKYWVSTAVRRPDYNRKLGRTVLRTVMEAATEPSYPVSDAADSFLRGTLGGDGTALEIDDTAVREIAMKAVMSRRRGDGKRQEAREGD
jgi:hypothetical protein